ncbi:MAG: hypothetical protein AB1716_05610 [Planctomycetota bacterium]
MNPFVPLSGPATLKLAGRDILTRRFRKDIIRVGRFVKSGPGGFELQVTPAHLAHWADTFASMKANGVRVSVPPNHESAGDAEKNRGWIESMTVEGDALVGVFQIIGEDGLREVARNDCSIFAPAQWTDGEGRTYEWPIRHVALTPDPVITGLGEFVPLAASHVRPAGPVEAAMERLFPADPKPATKLSNASTAGLSPVEAAMVALAQENCNV